MTEPKAAPVALPSGPVGARPGPGPTKADRLKERLDGALGAAGLPKFVNMGELQTTIQRMPARICFLGTFRDRCPKGSNCPYRHYGGEDPAYTEDALVAVVVEHERNRVATQQPRPVRV